MTHRLRIFTTLLALATYSISAEVVADAVHREQRQLLQQVIDSLAGTTNDVSAKTALRKLSASLKLYPCEYSCICETLLGCIKNKCKNLDTTVEQCITDCAQRSVNPREMTPEEFAIVQEKLSQLVQEFFVLQLALLGKFDLALQETLQRYHLDTYGKLATPYILFLTYYLLIDEVLAYLKEKLNIPSDAIPNDFQPVAEKAKMRSGEFTGNKPAAKSQYAIFEAVKQFCLSKPELKFVPTALFIPDMITNFGKIKQYTNENINQCYSRLTNRKVHTLYPVKTPRFTLETMPQYAHIKTRFIPLVDFCAHLTCYRGIDAQLSRGYILEGNLRDARSLGEALAGELAQRCKEKNAPYCYGVLDIHASKLLTKKISSLIAECDEYGPAVLVINDIDWLCEQTDIKPRDYAEIINELSKLASSTSNSNTIVILTTQDATQLERLLQESHRFTVISLS